MRQLSALVALSTETGCETHEHLDDGLFDKRRTHALRAASHAMPKSSAASVAVTQPVSKRSKVGCGRSTVDGLSCWDEQITATESREQCRLSSGRKANRHHDLDSQMREAILAGRLKPGEALAEAQLATQSGGKKTTLSQTYENDHSCFDRVSDSDECRWLCR
jgi:hypothetical protein